VDGKTMYVADQGNNMIRAIDLSSSTGKVTVFAGTLTPGTKDGAQGTAQFKEPLALACDKDFLYVGELDNHRIRAISLADKSTKTLLGKLTGGATTGQKDAALFTSITGIAVDLDANGAAKALYVYDPGSDSAGARIVKILP
jgi:sugar lactone lactonase YvrE